MAEVDRKKVQEQIKQQGDVVRQLKASGAEKDKVGILLIYNSTSV